MPGSALAFASAKRQPSNVWPKTPTRAAVCALQTSLQGLNYHTKQYGTFPAWWYPMLNAEDRAGARQSHLTSGKDRSDGVNDTHVSISLSAAYRESGTLWPEDLTFVGYDLAYDMPRLRALLEETIRGGLLVDLVLAGDGMSKNDNPQQGEYNDPVGDTYGWQWLMHNFERIALALKGDDTQHDLTEFILFRPGWDACFYGWGPDGEVPDRQPDRVVQFGALFRRVLPHGYLAMEHTPGHIPVGEGGGDFLPGGRMDAYDTILSEFATLHEDSAWQVIGRMVHPYNRPPDQPAGDDPNPPFYLVDSPRGPRYYVAFEPTKGGVYEWCRGRCTLADVNAVRDYEHAMGVTLVG